MIIDIEKIPQEGLKISREFEFPSTDLVEESAVFLRPLHADLHIKMIGDEIIIKGTITTCVSFICSRCLVPFEFPIDSKFDLIYFPEERDEFKEQLEKDDLGRLFYHSQNIDLEEIVLEQLNLSFPVKPLCSKNCQGICPVCGKLIQSGECVCVKEDSDPRLDKLKYFIKR
ncbi:MAG: DUF177 domain-containing protein [Candidatus Aminicenantes bacterium]|nr:DUF177 domain-containing protein [Candidatus Aminicenantes bacterium]